MHLQYPYHSAKVVTLERHIMKIFDSPNCGKAVSDERRQIEPAKLPLWRRIQRGWISTAFSRTEKTSAAIPGARQLLRRRSSVNG